MKTISSPAIILHHSDYGDSDRIVTFLTPEFGRLKGFARSARKSRKRFGAALESFADVQLHWVLRRSGELVSLRDAELVSLRNGLRRNLETVILASYGCELTEALFDESGVGLEVFELLRAFLDHLDDQGFSVEARLLFELRILSIAGYVPHLEHCAQCFGALPNGQVSFSAVKDGSLCMACDGKHSQFKVNRMTLGTLGRILKTPLQQFSGFRLSALSRTEGLAITGDALRHHLHRPLKSLDMLCRFSPGEQD